MADADLAELREEIARVTFEIFRLCGERLQLARKTGELKAHENMPLEDLKVEEELRENVLSVCRASGLDTGFCGKLLDLLLDESKRIQRDVLESGS